MNCFKSILVISLLISCSPQQRINQIIARHPDAIIFDSAKYTTTLILPGRSIPFNFSVDTIRSLMPGDTIQAGENKVTLTITPVNDSLSINVSILPDTIRKDTIIQTTIKVTPGGKRTFSRIDWILLILSLLAIISLLRFLFPKK